MSRDNFRTIGAITGLALGIVVMLMMGLSGILPGAAFGAGGCVIGGILGERVHDRRGPR